MQLVECVPNFSTSDPEVIDAIVETIDAIPNSKVLHTDPDPDYNRTVITLVSTLDYVVEAGFAAIKRASELVDMREHQGEHPRLGATDVYPLIPLQSSTFDDCIDAAHKLGQRVGNELNIPVYCYGKAALSQDRVVLSEIRKGQYEGLPSKLQDPKWYPDFGPSEFNPKSGATVIGVRDFLIAYNVNLSTDQIEIATKIARNIRSSGWFDDSGKRVAGSLEGIQAMGVMLDRPERGTFVQVSTNVLDYKHQDSIHDVFDAIQLETSKYDVGVTGSEIVGLVPADCIAKANEYYGFGRETIDPLITKLGLNDLYKFNPSVKILDRQLEQLDFDTP